MSTDNNNIHILDKVDMERDLGIYIKNYLKWDYHCTSAASKANRALGILCNNFSQLDTNLMCKLYKIYVRPHLEYAVQAWCPYFKKDIKVIEKIQRAKKIPFATRYLEYSDRLKHFKLQKLEDI